jgi:Carboxylesterase family
MLGAEPPIPHCAANMRSLLTISKFLATATSRRMLLLAFVVLLLNVFPRVASSTPVTLSSGTFRGLTVNGTDRWLGIPYAQPPVGPLRFKAPLPLSRPLEDIQDVFEFSHASPQPPTIAPISEDCLYLNVGRATV